MVIIGAAAGGGAAIMVLVCTVLYCCCFRKRQAPMNEAPQLRPQMVMMPQVPQMMMYAHPGGQQVGQGVQLVAVGQPQQPPPQPVPPMSAMSVAPPPAFVFSHPPAGPSSEPQPPSKQAFGDQVPVM